ncbi:MAG: hypothetical protein JW954_00130 [Dehalococcoidaceae bacterium]|nr:hypothetical protein [Dehalococcoidaceae bacterium]
MLLVIHVNKLRADGMVFRFGRVVYCLAIAGFAWLIVAPAGCSGTITPASLEGAYTYQDFNQPDACSACHQNIHQDWSNSLMALSFVHQWDDVEYFQLALPHARKLDEVSGIKSGCIACHGPLAYLAGDIPPAEPSAGTRVNEGVSCEVCHSITGSTGQEPFNFSVTMDVGDTKYGPRDDAFSTFHQSQYSGFTISSRLCATCHDEQNPYGAWVKETYQEWKDSSCSSENILCQDCHMGSAPGISAPGGKQRDDIAVHTFYGPHSENWLKGAASIKLTTDRPEARAGWTITIYADVINDSCGHYFPTGSTEERMLWLELWITDAAGQRYHLPCLAKGFEGEEYTIADSFATAYGDLGEIMEIAGFEGLSRDGDIPDGARIFRRPFFNPQGDMTICQWYTAENSLVNYRLAPGKPVTETYFYRVPDGLSYGTITVEADLYYALVPSSIGDFFGLPESEFKPLLIDHQSLTLSIVDWG